MIDVKINFETIQNRLSACRYMAEAGEQKEAKKMLITLAKEIVALDDEQPTQAEEK